ncbi:uncharacterized protein [Narcine bancroftii]|uniref:uncharacterized protein isoform X1 n=1 Tax=Narcine bancroftii TaxID=1343680 RepID=UPI003831F2A7
MRSWAAGSWRGQHGLGWRPGGRVRGGEAGLPAGHQPGVEHVSEQTGDCHYHTGTCKPAARSFSNLSPYDLVEVLRERPPLLDCQRF